MSCPQVAGICGLLLSRDPTLDNEDIRTILRETATDVMIVGRDLETGNGLANAYDALLYLGVGETELPRKSALAVYPNPFNAGCRIVSPSDIDIFDVSGRLVRTIPAAAGIIIIVAIIGYWFYHIVKKKNHDDYDGWQ